MSPEASERSRVEAVEIAVADERYPELSAVLAYWERKRGAHFAPRRADIDPADLVPSLPRITLSDVIRGDAADGPLDFRYRLCGTGICTAHWRDPTGEAPRDMRPAAYGELLYRHYCEAVHRRAPMLHVIVLDTLEKSLSYARLILPLSEDRTTVTMLMTVDSKEQNTRAIRDFFAKALKDGA
jgi:hypothetical protein